MDALSIFIDTLSQALKSSSETATSLLWNCRSVAPAPAPLGTASGFSACVAYNGPLEGQLLLQADEQALQLLFPGGGEKPDEDTAAAWKALAFTAAKSHAALLEATHGSTNVRLAEPVSSASVVTVGELTLSGKDRQGTILLHVDSQLHSLLQQHKSGRQDGLALNSPTSEKAPLGRVIDVPLAVKLRFGQRQLTLRELLELNTGSLVELDQQVEEPVHLMLGERVIARGEVVIVDGNYGMRVLEVVEHTSPSLKA